MHVIFWILSQDHYNLVQYKNHIASAFHTNHFKGLSRGMYMTSTDGHTDEEIRKIYNFKNIAVVGMSRDPAKAAHFVPKYMIEMGYNIIPVNPSAAEILGKRTYSRVSDIKSEVDIVDVFRPSEDVYPVVEDSIKKPGIRVIWLQEGIHNSNAEKIAQESNIDFVFNRCIMAEHMRLFNDD